MSILNWFHKSQDDDGSGQRQPIDENDELQGGITDYHLHPFELRQARRPMSGDELKAFEWVMHKMKAAHPEWDYTSLVDEATDLGWFYVGDDGMLHVSREEPK